MITFVQTDQSIAPKLYRSQWVAVITTLITIKTKLPKASSKIKYRRSYKRFNQALFEEEVKGEKWEKVYSEENPEKALSIFI